MSRRLRAMELSGVPPLRELVRRAKAAGADIRYSGGDYMIRFPELRDQKILRVNCRRKDGTPELVKALWRAEVDALPRNVCRMCGRLWVECQGTCPPSVLPVEPREGSR
jgi:hypothetical protein